MALLNFRKREAAPAPVNRQVEAFLDGYSIEVMPRTAEKVENFRDLLPKGTRVYIAHIEGTPIADMVATAARLAREGYPVMPHFPAPGQNLRAYSCFRKKQKVTGNCL